MTDVADDADDLGPQLAVAAERDARSDRVAVSPCLPAQGLVDDRDERPIGAVRLGEQTAREQWDPERLDITGRDDPVVRDRRAVGGVRPDRGAAAERQRLHGARSADAGQGAEAIEQRAIEQIDASIVGVARVRQRHRHRHHAVGTKSQIDRSHVCQRLREERGADEEDHSEGDLDGHKRLARPRGARTGGSLRGDGGNARARGRKRRKRAEQHTAADCNHS